MLCVLLIARLVQSYPYILGYDLDTILKPRITYVLCCIVLCCVVLCCVVLCYVML